VFLAMATFGLGLGRQTITEADEAYYAESAREMLASGDWLTPHYNFTDRWQKPVLYYWLTAATYAVAGTGEAQARLWSALSGVGLALLAWGVAKRDETTRPSAWLAGTITATCFGYVAMARSALPDLPLAFLISATIAAVFAAFDARGRAGVRWWLAAGVATGLGCLMKGPIAVVVPALAVVPAWWLERREARVHWPHVALAGGVAAAVALPWYVAMTMTHGVAYLESFFLADNLERFATTRFNETRPIWFYVPVIAGGLLPWTLFGALAAVPATVALARRQWRPARTEWRLLSWALVPTVFFMASVGQQPRYVLPVLPPLAILMARAISQRIERAVAGQGTTLLRAATWTTVGFCLLCSTLIVRLTPILRETEPIVLHASLAGFLASAIGLAALALRGHWTALPAVMTLAALALTLGIQFSVFSPGRPAAVERMASLVRTYRADARVGSHRAFARNLVFYTGVKQDDLPDIAGAAAFLASSEAVLLVVPETELPAVAAAAHVTPRILGKVQYLNTANLRLRTLLRPDPASELESVLLVTNK
jgi:hypothetical protein